MGGAVGDSFQRSSSPLKRRACSMEPEQDIVDAKDDVDMVSLPPVTPVPQSSETPPGHRVPEADMEEPASGLDELLQTRPSVRTDMPPVHEQIKTIETLVKAFTETAAREGDSAWLVSRKWLKTAQHGGADSKQSSQGQDDECKIGPVDNGDIIETVFTDDLAQECVKLKPGMGYGDFELFPCDAWELLLSWYGLAAGQIPIKRTAHNTALDSTSSANIQYEFHPPTFLVYRLWSANSPLPIEQRIKASKPPPKVVVQSSSHSAMKFLKDIKRLTGIPKETRARIWKVLQALPSAEAADAVSGMKTPPESPGDAPASTVTDQAPTPSGSWPQMLLEVADFLKLEMDTERVLVDLRDQTNNANYNGKRSLAFVELNVDQAIVLDEEIEKDCYVSNWTQSSVEGNAAAGRTSPANYVAQIHGNAGGRASPALSGPTTRGRQQRSGRCLGTVGLQNLGNTCYMNSAIQCVRSVEELTKYFLTGEAFKEINRDNPLSHNGDVAMAYGRLLEDIYRDPLPSSVAPRDFKKIIGKYAPAFSGYGQQDSQEFIGFLLDGLQEDLNRILKKPYIEKPDSTDDMINNRAAIREMAEKVWDITKKRDDSVIADLFTGMYKSTLVCPECSKVSITFDPFNNLTLPLPVESFWSRNIKYFPLNDPPVEIVVDIHKQSNMKELKRYVSERVGVPAERLFGAEEFRGKFFKFYEDAGEVSEEIQLTDHPCFFELEAPPTSLDGGKKFKKKGVIGPLLDYDEERSRPDDAATERLLVPVIHRYHGDSSTHRFCNKTDEDLPPPHFIVVGHEEAQSEEAIRRKVLEKIATYTTWEGLAADDETDTEALTDPELINTTSDMDSSVGSSKVVAKSVIGEEDMVDVIMNCAANSKAKEYPHLLKRFKNKRPAWIKSSEFLHPQAQNLFSMSFFSDAESLLPTGWQTVSENSHHPSLDSRMPKPPPSDVEMQSPGWDGSDSGTDDGSRTATASAVVTRMQNESSEEESDFAPRPATIGRPQLQHGRMGPGPRARKLPRKRKPTTYGRNKGRRFEKQPSDRIRPQPRRGLLDDKDYPVDDDGTLLRIGDGLICDWNEAAWSMVFDSNSANGRGGERTWINLPTLDDPTIAAKTKRRELRSLNGITLYDCLAEFEKEEVLSEQDTWYCPRCKEHRRATKKFDLWKSPDILVVHLKRFSSSGWRRDKLSALVQFPIENLDLTEHVIDKVDGQQEVYDLIAVDDHWGGLGGGHYTAHAKNFIDGEWYEYNDTMVTKVTNLAGICTNSAYLLFYRRRSEGPLGGPKFLDIFARYDQAPDEDAAEDQRRGQGSYLSAVTGAGLTHQRGNRGLARAMGSNFASDDSDPSPYGDAADEVHGASVPWHDGDTVRNSVEADEAIGMPEYSNASGAHVTSLIGPEWSFKSLDGTAAVSERASNCSDRVLVSSSVASPTLDVDGEESGAELMEGPGSFSVACDDSVLYDTGAEMPSPPGRMMEDLAQEAWARKAQHEIHNVPADVGADDGASNVAEIHVEEDEMTVEGLS